MLYYDDSYQPAWGDEIDNVRLLQEHPASCASTLDLTKTGPAMSVEQARNRQYSRVKPARFSTI